MITTVHTGLLWRGFKTTYLKLATLKGLEDIILRRADILGCEKKMDILPSRFSLLPVAASIMLEIVRKSGSGEPRGCERIAEMLIALYFVVPHCVCLPRSSLGGEPDIIILRCALNSNTLHLQYPTASVGICNLEYIPYWDFPFLVCTNWVYRGCAPSKKLWESLVSRRQTTISTLSFWWNEDDNSICSLFLMAVPEP